MEKREFINRIHELISRDLKIDGVEILYKSKEYFCAEYVSAHFNPLSYRIYINEDWLIRADTVEIIRVVAHEMRHAYQKANIDYPQFFIGYEKSETIELWKRNFDNYCSPNNENLSSYSDQSIELDADKYADMFHFLKWNSNKYML